MWLAKGEKGKGKGEGDVGHEYGMGRWVITWMGRATVVDRDDGGEKLGNGKWNSMSVMWSSSSLLFF